LPGPAGLSSGKALTSASIAGIRETVAARIGDVPAFCVQGPPRSAHPSGKFLADTIGKHSRRDGNISLQRRFGREWRRTARWIGDMGGHLSSSSGVGRKGQIAVHSLTHLGNVG
jgi:hypothetical protein